MRINDCIYFSPTLLLENLDLTNKELVMKSFTERIENYYFKPIEILNENKQAFASGAILCLLIDAFARYSTTEDRVGVRIKNWCTDNLGLSEKTSKDFYEFFRCGLLHESHIKSFGQFTFDNEFHLPIKECSGFVVVNPFHLYSALRNYFNSFISNLETDEQLYSIFIDRLNIDFKDEVQAAKQ